MIKKIANRLRHIYKTRLYQPFCQLASPIISPAFEKLPRGLKSFSDDKAHIFFGYYDISPINTANTCLLACRTYHSVSTPHLDYPILEVGYYDLTVEDPIFRKLDDTTTWNWQQGCRLQYIEDGKKIIYNFFNGDGYGSKILSYPSGEPLKTLPVPVYIVAPDGTSALTLNFSRLHRHRPGYGYSQCEDFTANELATANDGLFSVDLDTGEISLVISLVALSMLEPHADMAGASHYLNHLDYSPDGRLISFMHIWITSGGKRRNRIVICNRDGSDIRIPTNQGHASHHRWKSNNEILIYSRLAETGMNYHLFKLDTARCAVVGAGKLLEDGHPSFLNETQLITDTYPDAWNMQRLLKYSVRDNSLTQIAKFYSPPLFKKELRCDLHPRLNADGSLVCVDYIRDGRRAMAFIPLS